MCGFIFIPNTWNTFKHNSQKVSFVQQGLTKMQYRGLPNRTHVYDDGRSILGHVRLPIMNLSEEYDQPLHVDRLVVAHVGEIFNYQLLGLPAAPTDTITLAETFRTKGLKGFHEFDGFWGSVILDPRKDQAWIITDYLCQKPVYWHTVKNVFASELDVLIDLDVTLNERYLSNVAKWGYDPTGGTPYTEVSQIPPGCAVFYHNGRFDIRQYWDWNLVSPGFGLQYELMNAVRLRLTGNQPVSALVSGGLDSAIVYGLVDELGATVQAFHVDNDEASYARLVAPEATALSLEDVSVAEALEAHQVPVDLGSMVPQLALAQAVSAAGYHVALTGDGADELFGGYRRAKEYDSQWSDVFCELPYYHMPRLDRLMMRHTVELRTPYLAPKVIKAALLLPYEYRTEKQVLKHTFSYLVPPEVLAREKKPLKSSVFAEPQSAMKYRLELIARFVFNFHEKRAAK